MTSNGEHYYLSMCLFAVHVFFGETSIKAFAFFLSWIFCFPVDEI